MQKVQVISFPSLKLKMNKLVPNTNDRKQSLLYLGLLVIATVWLFLLLLLWFYQRGSTDEGAYHYQALMLANGKFPVIDFFTTHMSWAYIPYAFFLKYLGPSIEAARVFCVLSIIGVTIMVTLIVKRYFGLKYALFSFLLLAFSWTWLNNNLEVRHSGVANLSLVSAFFVLTYFRRYLLIRSFLIGLLIGITINSRAVLLPVSLAILLLLYLNYRDELNINKRLHLLAFFSVGTLISSTPTIYIFISDRDAFLYNYLLKRVELSQYLNRFTPISQKLMLVFDFFTKTELLFILPVILSLLGLLFSGRYSTITNILRNKIIQSTLIIIVSIYLSYFMADVMSVVYLHHWIPFLTILIMGIMHFASVKLAKMYVRLINITFLFGLSVYISFYLYNSLLEITLRNDYYIKNPTEISRIACWIEANVPENEVVMSYIASPVAASGRRLPDGLDQGVGILSLFWRMPSIKEDTYKQYKVLSFKHHVDLMKNGYISYLIKDNLPEQYISNEEKLILKKTIDDYYSNVEGMSGNFSYKILIHNNVDSGSITRLTHHEFYRSGKEGYVGKMIQDKEYLNAALSVAEDIIISFAALPGDLKSSFARLIWTSYEDRCGAMLKAID